MRLSFRTPEAGPPSNLLFATETRQTPVLARLSSMRPDHLQERIATAKREKIPSSGELA
jgi:hypothetical protein